MGAFTTSRSALRARGPRYLTVAAGNVVFGQLLLLGAVTMLSTTSRWSINAATVVLAAVPAYHANRTWVWEVRGRSDLRREVVPFWVFVAIGLVSTTVAVAVAESAWSSGGGRMPGPVTNAVNISVIGGLWVARFFWMDHAFDPRSQAQLGPAE